MRLRNPPSLDESCAKFCKEGYFYHYHEKLRRKHSFQRINIDRKIR